MRSNWVISGFGHAAVLAFGLLSIAGSMPRDASSNFVPVSIVANADISQAPIGQQNAPVIKDPKPLADKLGEQKPAPDAAPKVVEKPAIKTEAPAVVPQPKPEPKPEPKPKPKQVEKHEKKTPDFKADRIAELLNKETEKPKPEQKHDAHKFNANQVAELLDKRDPQRTAVTGKEINNTPGLGAPVGAPNAQLSQTEIDALRERIRQCWSPPPGIDSNSQLYVVLRVFFRPDGSLADPPIVVEGSASPLGPALAESGRRALLSCQPFTMLRPEHYAQWKDISVKFNPHELIGN